VTDQKAERKRNCLTCEYEPKWKRHKVCNSVSGMCRFPVPFFQAKIIARHDAYRWLKDKNNVCYFAGSVETSEDCPGWEKNGGGSDECQE